MRHGRHQNIEALRNFYGTLLRAAFYALNFSRGPFLRQQRQGEGMCNFSSRAFKNLSLFLKAPNCRKWPIFDSQTEAWLLVRTHLIPKDIYHLPGAGDFRPLSIMSVWYRLWSSYRMHQLGAGYYDYFSPALRGGLPSRGIDDAVPGPLLHLEATRGAGRNQIPPLHMVSIDASKCFDRIRYPSASQAALHSGMAPRLVGLLLGFWTQLRRFFSANGFLDGCGIEPCNGIPQGCPLSALVCNCLVQQWHCHVSGPRCRALAYLDDRHLWADAHQDLSESWKKSKEREREHGWVAHPQKCAHIQSHPDRQTLAHEDAVVPKKEHIVTLGVDIPMLHVTRTVNQEKRNKNAISTAQKIEMLALPKVTAQWLVESVVLAQFSAWFGAWFSSKAPICHIVPILRIAYAPHPPYVPPPQKKDDPRYAIKWGVVWRNNPFSACEMQNYRIWTPMFVQYEPMLFGRGSSIPSVKAPFG